MDKMHEVLLITQITRLALLVNGSTPHDVFFNFSGHVNAFKFHVHENGWRKGADPTKLIEVNELVDIETKLNEILSYLSDLYTTEVQKINV